LPTYEVLTAQIADINDDIQAFHEELEEAYQTEKSKLLDYPIFMAIADNIGYDATGKDSFKVLSKEEGYTYKGEPHTREVQENDLFVLEVLKKTELIEGKPQLVTKRQTVVPDTGIAGELKRFVQAIEAGKDSFFV
jgi:type I restriction enzyme M protein